MLFLFSKTLAVTVILLLSSRTFRVNCNQEPVTPAHLPYTCTLFSYNQAGERPFVQIKQM
jgi:hypothetical protein